MAHVLKTGEARTAEDSLYLSIAAIPGLSESQREQLLENIKQLSPTTILDDLSKGTKPQAIKNSTVGDLFGIVTLKSFNIPVSDHEGKAIGTQAGEAGGLLEIIEFIGKELKEDDHPPQTTTLPSSHPVQGIDFHAQTVEREKDSYNFLKADSTDFSKNNLQQAHKNIVKLGSDWDYISITSVPLDAKQQASPSNPFRSGLLQSFPDRLMSLCYVDAQGQNKVIYLRYRSESFSDERDDFLMMPGKTTTFPSQIESHFGHKKWVVAEQKGYSSLGKIDAEAIRKIIFTNTILFDRGTLPIDEDLQRFATIQNRFLDNCDPTKLNKSKGKAHFLTVATNKQGKTIVTKMALANDGSHFLGSAYAAGEDKDKNNDSIAAWFKSFGHNADVIIYGDDTQAVDFDTIASDNGVNIVRRSSVNPKDLVVTGERVGVLGGIKLDSTNTVLMNGVPQTEAELSKSKLSTYSVDQWKTFHNDIENSLSGTFKSRLHSKQELIHELTEGILIIS